MAYDQGLAERLRDDFRNRGIDVEEKKMFGGMAFMVNGNMCVGINDDDLMARVGKENHDSAAARPHARSMDFTGRPMKGFLYVGPEGYESDKDLADWVDLCLNFVLTLPAK